MAARSQFDFFNRIDFVSYNFGFHRWPLDGPTAQPVGCGG